MNLIEFKNVDFSYYLDDENEQSESNEIKVLENFSLAIEKGSFTAILGHNGSGKSTIAKLTNGILFAKNGEVIVDGQVAREDDSIFDIRKKSEWCFKIPITKSFLQ